MLNIFPSETLYSALVRHCLISGYPSLKIALLVDIGSTSKQWTAQFPSFIPQLSDITGLTPNELIREHTVYPAYRTFLSRDVATHLDVLLENGGATNLESKMSITANRVKKLEELNFCSECVKGDIEQFSWSYWHTEHQLPGALACLKHGIELNAVSSNRKKFILPPSDTKLSSKASAKAIRLTSLSCELFSHKEISFVTQVITQTYKIKLLELGLATSNQKIRVRMQKWRQYISEYWQGIAHELQIKSIIKAEGKQLFPSNLIYCRHVAFHPIKHLLAIGFLFNTVDEFIALYKQVEAGTFSDTTNNNQKPLKLITSGTTDKKIIKLLQQNKSLRVIAKKLKVSVGYVKKIAFISNIQINHRTQFIFEKEQRAIWRKLFVGIDCKTIATEMGVSVGAVEQILSCHPKIVALRKKIRFYNKCKTHRKNITEASKKCKTRNEIKAVESASYLWLFKNDKSWLYSNLPAAIPRKKRYIR
jgi:hypothetical protein